MTQWQPIETAPMDGTDVMLLKKDGSVLITCWQIYRRWQIYPQGKLYIHKKSSKPYSEITHWMPFTLPGKPNKVVRFYSRNYRPIEIIAGFPGVGKSHYQEKHPECLDMNYSYYRTQGRRMCFPDNYLREIVQNVQSNEYRAIFVSTHAEVLKGLTDYGFKFTVVYPHIDLKEEYLERYRQRYPQHYGYPQSPPLPPKKMQSPPPPLKTISDNWDDWITALQASPYKKHRLTSGQFLADVIGELWTR